jgi:hypothetical protein
MTKRTRILAAVVLIVLVTVTVCCFVFGNQHHEYIATYQYALQRTDPVAFELKVKALTDIQIVLFGAEGETVFPLIEEKSMSLNIDRKYGWINCYVEGQAVRFFNVPDVDMLGDFWVKSGNLIYWVEGEDGRPLAGIRIIED